MSCEKCGNSVEDGQTLCSSCAAQQTVPEDDVVTAMGDTFDLNTPDEAARKKSPRKKGRLIAAIVAVAIVLACTLGVVFNMDAVNAFVGRTFKSPEDYFVEVESAAIAEYKEDLTESYGVFLESYEENATAAEGEIRLTVGDMVMSLLETSLQQQGLQMDIDWLSDIRLSVSTNTQDTLMQTVLGIGLGDHDLLSADMILDAQNGKVYGTIPELNKDYLSADLSSDISADEFQKGFTQSRAMNMKLVQALPSEEALGDLIDTYTDHVLSGIKKVEKQDGTITVNGVTQEVVVLKATMTEADLLDITTEVLIEARDDQNLKKVINGYGDYINEMGKLEDEYYVPVDLYQEFVDSIDAFLAQMDETKAQADSNNYMELTTYVDMRSRVRGHHLAVYSDGQQQFTAEWKSVVEDATTYTEADLGQITITGEKTTKKDISNGFYTLFADGKEQGTLEFEDMTDNGGTLRLSADEELLKELLSDSSIPAAVLADNAALELTYDVADSGKVTYEVSLLMGTKPLITLAVSAEATAGGSITVPSNASDATNSEELAQWLANVDLENVLTALENANVPQELVDVVRGYAAMLQYGMANS